MKRVYKSETYTEISEARPGLLELENGTIIFKTEYGKPGNPECYVVESGETFTGPPVEYGTARCRPIIIK